MKAKFLFAAAFAFAVFTAEAFDNFAQAFQAARQARSSRKLDEALKNLEEAKSLAQNPAQKVQALNFAADICWQKNDLKGAIAKLDEIISIENATPNQKTYAASKKGNYLKWKGKRADAEKAYKQAMGFESVNDAKQDLYNSYADLHRANKKYGEALKLYQESLAVEKPNPYHVQNAKLGIARVTAEQKQYDKALELYTEVTKIPKVNKWIEINAYREMIDKVYFPQKKFAEAKDVLAKLEADNGIPKNQKDDWNGACRIRMAIIQARDLMRQKKLDEAAEILKGAHDNKTSWAWVKQHLADAEADVEFIRGDDLRRQKKLDEAIATYKKALETKNISIYKKHTAMIKISEVLMWQKKFDEAKECIEKSMELPKLPANQMIFSLCNLANYYLAKQNVDEAIAAAEKAAAVKGNVHPDWKAYAYAKLADIYFTRKKDLAKAEEYMKKAMAVPKATWGKNPGLMKRIQKAVEQKKQ